MVVIEKYTGYFQDVLIHHVCFTYVGFNHLHMRVTDCHISLVSK